MDYNNSSADADFDNFNQNEEENQENSESFYEEEIDVDITQPDDIVTYNELRSCADIYRMVDTQQIDIKPDFQRDLVWKNADKSRFIDSLLKQLPIPSMCISYDVKTNKRLVIDGLQRISTMVEFLSQKNWRLSKLGDIDSRINGNRNDLIRKEYPIVFNIIQNLTIPITVIRCDLSQKSHAEYIYMIFKRLNQTGVKLSNQEIRNAIYSGIFNNMLKDVVASNAWTVLFPVNSKKINRFKGEELILRTFAFSFGLSDYEGNLARFLNDFMQKHRNDNEIAISEMKTNILSVLDIIKDSNVIRDEFLAKGNSYREALMVGLFTNIDNIEVRNINFDDLKRLPELQFDKLSQGSYVRDVVLRRLQSTQNFFRNQ